MSRGRLGRSADLADAAGQLVFDGLAATTILGHFAYVFAFDLLSDELRLGVAGALLALQLTLAAWCLLVRPAMWSGLIALAMALKIAAWLFSWMTLTASPVATEEAMRIVLRELVPYVASIWLLSYAERLSIPLVRWTVLGAAGLAGLLAIAGPPLHMVDGSVRLFPFTGGAGDLGLHPSAYFVMLLLLMVDELRIGQRLGGRLSIAIELYLSVLIVGYQVRTTWAMVAAYAIGHAHYSRWRHLTYNLLLIAVALVVIGLAFGMVATHLVENVESWGSGRIGSYEYRFDMLLHRDLTQLLFGTGPGSDDIVIPIWWWGVRDAHNDILDAMIETGFVGLAGILLFLAGLWMRLGQKARPLIWALLASSLVSNGMLSRPTEFVFLALAMALAESSRQRSLPLVKHEPRAEWPEDEPRLGWSAGGA
jgi:hypothetical protein